MERQKEIEKVQKKVVKEIDVEKQARENDWMGPGGGRVSEKMREIIETKNGHKEHASERLIIYI